MITIIPEAGSTNRDLLTRLSGGEQITEGTWLVARRQTAGLGRQGRAWFDGAGNFMGSAVVWLGPSDPPPPSLALLAGLAVQRSVSAFLPPERVAVLKWPNDVLVAGGKISGVLVQREGAAAVVGVGVNLARAPDVPGRLTVALADYGPVPSLDAFADTLAACLTEELALWRAGGLAGLLPRWQAAAHPLGTVLRVHDGQGAFVEGAFAGLAEDGALRLGLADGRCAIIHAGDTELAPAGGHA